MSNDTMDAVGTTLVLGTLAVEKVTLKGLGVEGGEALDASHLENSAVRTYKPQTLKMIKNITGTGHYDPSDLAALLTEINKNQSMVLTFAGIGTITFWGYLIDFDPDEGEIGATWNASFEIQVTNLNGSDVETAPVWAAAT